MRLSKEVETPCDKDSDTENDERRDNGTDEHRAKGMTAENAFVGRIELDMMNESIEFRWTCLARLGHLLHNSDCR